jgi:aminopeptidase YwaD
MKKLLLIVAFTPACLYSTFAQSKKQNKAAIEASQKADKAIFENLQAHVQFLADDKLQGRSTGSEGEALAVEYISNQFKTIGLQPAGTNGYVQEFTIEDGKKIDGATFLKVNGHTLQLHKDYVPLAYSAAKAVDGMPSMALRERGVPWFIDVKSWLDTNKENPHYDINEAIKAEATKVAARGATALFVYNSGKGVDNIRFNDKDKTASSEIPVIYVLADGLQKYFKDPADVLDIEMNTAFVQKSRKGHNVAGYINNNAARTIVIGAHFDHLGWGDDGGALDTGKVIHNGADDNASGTAAMIELARVLSKSTSASNNYLFLAFSGEELGLLGSKYWLENPTVSTPINYMVNLDMVGRYDATKKLSIGGYGTSPSWAEVLTAAGGDQLQLKLDSTGGGPSDHAAFYRKDIPVLFFFTGNHADYHKATDDVEKMNFEGQLQIVKLISRIVEATNNKGKLAFLKTSEPQMGTPKYSVSLGVIPDYSSINGGLRIDGVSPKKLAAKLGLQAGDILTNLGVYKIDDINTYMQALANFKTGDKTTLRIKRGKDEKEFNVEF